MPDTRETPDNDSDGYVILGVENAMTGLALELELPVNSPMRDLLPAIAEQLQMRPQGLQLRNKSQGFTYGEMDTLESRSTNEKDFCQLSAVAEQG